LSGLAAGCSSSKPAYCTDAANLKTSVSNLGNAYVAKNGLDSLQTALGSVQTSANALASDAKSAFPSQITALQNSVSGLENAIKSAKGQPLPTAAAAVVPAVTQVKTSGQRAAERRIRLRQMLVSSARRMKHDRCNHGRAVPRRQAHPGRRDAARGGSGLSE
jgi:hypothetical protein